MHQEACKRGYLRKEWGSFKKIVRPQPIDDIKDYYGLKMGLYFLWLGFYTYMLIPAALMGIVALIYGLATLPKDKFSKDVCNSDFIMCPQCDINCDYWNIKQACSYTRITYFFDNDFTIVFAIFMSVWSTVYLELWKRYSANMTHHWGLTGYDLYSEIPRSEYLAEEKRRGEISYWRHRLPWLVLSFSMAFCIVSDFLLQLYRLNFYI